MDSTLSMKPYIEEAKNTCQALMKLVSMKPHNLTKVERSLKFGVVCYWDHETDDANVPVTRVQQLTRDVGQVI